VKWLILISILSLSFQPVLAQSPASTYIGLYLDANHESWCALGTPAYDIEMWVWVLPGTGGFTGAQFDMPLPIQIIDSNWVSNPNRRTMIKRRPGEGPEYSIGFYDCQTSWVWLFHATLTVPSPDPAMIQVQHYPSGENHVTVWDCNNDELQARVLSNLYINNCQPLPTNPTTWGAIKNLYGE